MRTTHALVQVAMAMMADPDERHWGYSLGKDSGVRSGVLYPILRRMLDDGWVDDGWESAEEARKRPPRRYYVLTEKGREELGRLLQTARNDPRFRGLGLGFAQ
ncbi:PadR family transcriptional regulator [Amycolatopsis mediterranei]|uniref:PadR family transcriptional regulator n=1 Tax=Amycolatopsis mediterranei TaxID=33910 RepID=UPI0034244897